MKEEMTDNLLVELCVDRDIEGTLETINTGSCDPVKLKISDDG